MYSICKGLVLLSVSAITRSVDTLLAVNFGKLCGLLASCLTLHIEFYYNVFRMFNSVIRLYKSTQKHAYHLSLNRMCKSRPSYRLICRILVTHQPQLSLTASASLQPLIFHSLPGCRLRPVAAPQSSPLHSRSCTS